MITTLVRKAANNANRKGFVAQKTFQGQRVLVANHRQYAHAMSKVAEIIGKLAK